MLGGCMSTHRWHIKIYILVFTLLCINTQRAMHFYAHIHIEDIHRGTLSRKHNGSWEKLCFKAAKLEMCWRDWLPLRQSDSCTICSVCHYYLSGCFLGDWMIYFSVVTKWNSCSSTSFQFPSCAILSGCFCFFSVSCQWTEAGKTGEKGTGRLLGNIFDIFKPKGLLAESHLHVLNVPWSFARWGSPMLYP